MLGDISWMDFGYVIFFGYCASALRLAANFRNDKVFKFTAMDIVTEMIISTGMSVGVIGAYMYLHFQKTSLLLFAFGATLAYEHILNLFKNYFIERATQVMANTGDSNVRPSASPK